MRKTIVQTLCASAAACALAFVTGCESTQQTSAQPAASAATAPTPAPAAAPAPAATPAPAAAPTPVASAPTATRSIIRIKAGSSTPFTDSSGNVWQAEKGFNGGDTVERDASTAIANTKDPGLYLSEHYSMDSFTLDVPNGKYIAKLYFAETFDGITGPGQRVFSFNVQGQDFKDVDLYVKAGGPNRAYVVTVPVEVTDGKFKITFTPNVENPEINAIELDPQ